MGPKAMYRLSEKAITLAWEERIDLVIHSQVMHADALIQSRPFGGWVENVPAYHTLTIYFDPVNLRRNPGYIDAYQFLEGWLSRAFQDQPETEALTQRKLRVPVCYDLSLGFDLIEAAARLHLSVEELITLHCRQTYHVFMLGFLPGFPYMGILPENLVLERKAVPLIKVPAGTVAIAGRQTGIYPVDSPGGWYAIGRTPVALFREGQAYFEPGDLVEFYAISYAEYQQWTST